MDKTQLNRINNRTTVLYAVVLLIGLVFIGRLFYLQIVKHDYFKAEALSEQQSKFAIQANRGQIYALDGSNPTPMVLNQNLKTVFADPTGIEDSQATADALAEIINKKPSKIKESLEAEDTRYSIIAKRLSGEQAKAIEEASLNGIGLTDQFYRAYPQNSIASQILGFVNNDGNGQYGLEEALNDQLKGQNGRLKAVTDVYGIPLSSNQENVIDQPTNGDDVTLTIDINIQRYVETAIAKGVQNSGGKSGSAIVIDPNSGAVKAMANYPSYKVDNYTNVEDYSRFNNDVVSRSYETGSGMKIFTMSSGLNEGVITKNSIHQDIGYTQVDDRKIENAEGAWGSITMSEVIQRSVNSGVIDVLKRLGGGELNEQGRKTFYKYLTENFGFGAATGIAQANESAGQVFEPNTGDGDNVRYSNMSFGQGMKVTLLQMVSGLSSIINGGDYYQPHLVYSTTGEDGQETLNESQILRTNTVSESVSKDIKEMMNRVVNFGGGTSAKRDGYYIGGKTGTSQVIDEETGLYSEFREVGSFMGFGGRTADTPEYVIMTRVDEPSIYGYAGSVAAAPIFADISNFMIEYYQIPPVN